jgi:hypothetical protein
LKFTKFAETPASYLLYKRGDLNKKLEASKDQKLDMSASLVLYAALEHYLSECIELKKKEYGRATKLVQQFKIRDRAIKNAKFVLAK